MSDEDADFAPEGLQPPEGWEGIEARHWEYKLQDKEVCGGCLMLWPCDAKCLLDSIQRLLSRPWE
jgi:hypothetical protein